MGISIMEALRKTTDAIHSWTSEKLTNKVDKIDGKALSTNDYTEADKQAVSNIATDLTLLDNKLYLSKNGELLSNGVSLPSGGGTGGSSGGSITLVNELESSIITAALNNDVLLKFNYTSSEDTTGDGVAYVYVDDVLKLTTSITPGSNTINIGAYVGEGTSVIKLTCMDVYSNSKSLSFTTNIISLRVTSTFSDSQTYSGNINIRYTPYGAIEKDIHFVLNDVETIVTTSETGKQQTYTISELSHGVYKLQIYATAEIDGKLITSNILNYEVMVVEEGATTPLLSSVYTTDTITQGELVSIPFTVYDPVNLEAQVVLSISKDGEIYSENTRTVDSTRQTWSVRDYPIGEVLFTITYGVISKTHKVTVVENDIQVTIKETDLEFQLTSAGRSNEDDDRDVWADGDVTTTFQYVNWDSSGWVEDSNGDIVLRLFGDAKATINFQPFKTDARATGRSLELVYTIRDVNNRDAVAISCLSNGVGFVATADMAKISSEQTSVNCRYTDEEKLYVTFVIEPTTEYRLMSVYLNGVLSGVQQYPAGDNLQQNPTTNITIGSEYCSVDIYSIRSYSTALTHDEVRNNYIASITDLNEKLSVYDDNDIYDIYGNLSFDELKDKICTMTIIGALPTYKGDKKNVLIDYLDPFNSSLCFSDSASLDIQGTSSAGYVRKNWKIKASNSHQWDESQMPGRVYCFKVDYMDSSGCHNTVSANYAHTLYGDVKTPPQEINDKCRTVIYGKPCILFHKADSASEPEFLGKANFNWDKGAENVFGFDSELYPDAYCWEFCNNTSDACLFHGPIPEDFGDDFEARYPDGSANIASFKIMHDWVVSTWQDGATNNALSEEYIGQDGVIYTSDTAEYRLAKFKKEFTEHFDMDFSLIYYLFTLLLVLMDNRAKNCFLCTWDGIHWQPWLYDMDSCLGVNNEGILTFEYDVLDTDIIDGTGAFNGQSSTLWTNFREAFSEEIAALYAEWRSSGLVTFDKIVDAFITNHTSKFSASIYTEDQDFKYISMLRESNNATYLFLTRGSAEHHLRYFMDNRLMFLDSKFNCGDYPSDEITLRLYTPGSDVTVEPNHDFALTSYSNVYLGVKYKANGTLMQKRVSKNTPTLFEAPDETFDDTETYLYPASEISSIGDISPMYCGYLDISKATKLTELIVGAGGDYSNPNFVGLSVGSNNLLNKIDVRNCPNLTDPLELSNCPSVETILAEGSGITSVELPSSGFLKTIHLPSTITNITITNQQYIEDFQCEGYNNLTTLRVEGSVGVPIETIINTAPNLNRVRIIDAVWTAESEEQLAITIERFKSCLGLDANGQNTDKAVVTGRVYVPSISDELYNEIYRNFPNLVVDDGNVKYIVDYRDWDGSTLHIVRVEEGSDAYDPIEKCYIEEPYREPDENYSYEFAGWSNLPVNISKHVIITAQYTTKVAINFCVDDEVVHTEYVVYGKNCEDPVANGTIDPPVKEGTGDLQYAFNGWDGSLLNITMPRVVNALFTSVHPVRFYSTPSSPTPHYVQWIKEGEDAHDPSTDEGYTTPPDILDTDIEDKKYVFSAWDNLPTSVTSICKVYATYDSYWAVRFYNEPIDGKGYKEVDVQWIKETYSAVDPITRVENPIEKPTKESTAQYDFTFSVWEGDYTNVTEARKIYAVYNNTTRRYNVYFCNMTQNNVLYTVENVLYGGSANYYGPTPVKMGVDDPENYVFMGWSPLPEKIEGETYCYALFRYNAYLFGKLGEEDQGWGTIEAPNWSAINSYWTQIDSDVDAFENNSITEDEFKKKYPIGGRMLIPVIVDGVEYNADVEIIEYNHDNLADGSGKATLTFMCKNLPGFRKPMYGSSVDNAGWEHSTMREFCNGELFNAFPAELQAIIEPVLKISDGGEVNRALVTTTDKCWLASYPEVGFASISEVLPGQGEVYASTYSTNKNSRVKYLPDGYTPYGWWLRSSSYSLTSDSALFCRVQASGILYGDIETNKYAVVFGFCI